MTDLELYHASVSKFDEIKQEAETSIKKKVWTQGHYFNVEPFEFERLGFKKGKILNSIPKLTKNKFCYAFDSEEKLICRQEGIQIPDQFQYTFYKYINTQIHALLFNNNHSLINAKIISFANNKISEMRMCAKNGTRIEKYNYDANTLKQIDVAQKSGTVEAEFKVLFFYDANGELVQIKNVHPNGYEEIRYKID